MEKLATKLRYMQFYAHNAHNMCKGDTFFSDHEELGELYGTYEGLYDSVVERMIGTGQTIDLVKVQTEAVKMLDSDATPTSNDKRRAARDRSRRRRAHHQASVPGARQSSDGIEGVHQPAQW